MKGTRPSLRLSTSSTDVPVEPALPVRPDLQLHQAIISTWVRPSRSQVNAGGVLSPAQSSMQGMLLGRVKRYHDAGQEA